MTGLVTPALYALFVWWAGTGVVLLLNNLPRATVRWSLAAATLLFAVALVRLRQSAGVASEAEAYAAFTYAVLAWAWHEMSFFMGVVTGPRRVAAPAGCTTGERFRAGLLACLWHELALLGTLGVVVGLTWGAPNQVGTATFLLLYVMRTSAKLNVFLGVLNLGEEFLPARLLYLRSFMARRRMNLLMPVSITMGTVGTVWLVKLAVAAPGAAQAAGPAMLATLLGLAVLEHWFLVLPIPFARLWSWALRVKTGPGLPATRNLPRGTGHGLPALLP